MTSGIEKVRLRKGLVILWCAGIATGSQLSIHIESISIHELKRCEDTTDNCDGAEKVERAHCRAGCGSIGVLGRMSNTDLDGIGKDLLVVERQKYHHIHLYMQDLGCWR